MEDVPQQYKNTLINANVTVNFDAKVNKIDSDIFPVWTAGKYEITQTDVDNIAKVLIPSEAKIYDMEAQSDTLTKSEIQDKILGLKAEIERIKKLDYSVFYNEFGEGYTKESAIEDVNNQIDSYESMYNNVPDEKPIVDSNLVFKDTVNGKEIGVLVQNKDNTEPKPFMVFRDFVRYGNDETNLIFALTDKEFTVQDSKTMGITLKEAEGQASSALQKMGIDNMIEIASGLINVSKQNEAYFIKYQRVLDNKYAFSNIETVPQIASENEMDPPTLNVDYSETLEPEELTVVLDKEGIADLFWINAKGGFKKTKENVRLLPFEDIIKKAEDNIFYKTYVKKEDKVTININSIVLSYMCVKNKNDTTTLFVIPVWDFIGFHEYARFGGHRVSGSYLTLNAIDGTVIDRELGY